MQFLIACGDVFDRRDDRLQLLFGFFELLMGFYDLLQRRHLLLGLASVIERNDQFLRLRNSFATGANRFGFFGGNRKLSARFESLLGRFPPPFPFRFGKHVANQPIADLLHGCLAVEAFENVAHDCHRIFDSELFYSGEIVRLSSKKMLGRNDDKIFRRVFQLHGVRFLGREINDDLVEEKIPLRHATESPALVLTKSSPLELLQLRRSFGSELSRFD